MKSNRILVMTAVSAEQQAIIKGLNGDARFDVELAGVGPVSAAARTAVRLQQADYALVVSAGIGGAFPGKSQLGAIVLADNIIAADLGVQTGEEFLSLEKLEFGRCVLEAQKQQTERLLRALEEQGMPIIRGPVLTVATATGTDAAQQELLKRVPAAAAEAMEGFGVAFAAFEQGIPVIEVRAVSNWVGPRDRSAWKMKEAFAALEKAAGAFAEVLI